MVVVFTANNARILHVEDSKPYESWENAVINPDLSKVKKIPPHLWKLHGREIKPMDKIESISREYSVSLGAVNSIENTTVKPRLAINLFNKYVPHLISAFIGAVLAALIQNFLSK